MAQNIRINFVTNGRDVNAQIERLAGSLKRAAGTSGGLKKVNQNLNLNARAATLASNSVKDLAGNVRNLISLYLGFQAVRGATTALVDFSKATAEVQTIAGLAPARLKELKGTLVEISAQTGKDAATLARTFYQIQSAGITNTAAAQNVLLNATKLSIGGLADLESTVNAVTKVFSVYTGEFKDAADITDVLFKSVKLGQVRVEELAIGLPQVISLGKSLGLAFSDVSGAVAAFSKRAGTAALGVTQLRSVFSGIIRGQERAKNILGENAKLFSLQALRTKGLAEFLRDLNNAVDGNQSKLFKLFGRVEALTGVTAGAADGFKDLETIIKAVGSTSNDTDKAFLEITKSIGGQLDILAQASKALFLKFGISGEGAVVNVLRTINDGLLDLVKNSQETFIRLKSLLITGGIILFGRFSIQAVAAIKRIQLQFIQFRAGAAAAMTGAKVSVLSFVSTLKVARIAVSAFKAVATLGLSLVLDQIVLKVLTLKERFGSFTKVLEVFKLQGKIALKEVGIFLDELTIKAFELANKGLKSVNDGIVSLANLVGIKLNSGPFENLSLSANASKKNIELAKKEVAALDAELTKLKENAREPAVASTDNILNFGSGKPSKIPGIPDENETEAQLTALRERVALFKEEQKVLEDEERNLIQGERLLFLQEQLGTEEALKIAARKQALTNLGKGKQAELELEKKFLEKKKGIAKAEVKFTELTGKEKLAATQSTLQKGIQLAQGAGSSSFGITKALSISEATVAGVLAVQKTLASSPYPLNIINAGLISAITAQNVSRIASSKPPSFRTGGIVPGTPTGGRDSVLAQVEPREAILTRNQQAQLFRIANGEVPTGQNIGEALNNLANAIADQTTVVEIDGRQVALAVRDQRLAGVA
jgi:TP901 family phage tail tape measure protein